MNRNNFSFSVFIEKFKCIITNITQIESQTIVTIIMTARTVFTFLRILSTVYLYGGKLKINSTLVAIVLMNSCFRMIFGICFVM